MSTRRTLFTLALVGAWLGGCEAIVLEFGTGATSGASSTGTTSTGAGGGAPSTGTTGGASSTGGGGGASSTGGGGGILSANCGGLAETCGPDGNESCCASFTVVGGTFNRKDDAAYPATVSDFKLDRFEVTVGRFRAFVAGYPANKPVAGAGAHPLIGGSGWNAAWDGNLPANPLDLKKTLALDPDDCTVATWTDEVGENENKPLNCLDWYEAFSFCAWDGGRLPTEAEWHYAASGGIAQRKYPWGDAILDSDHAVFNCIADGSPSILEDGGMANCVLADILNVGSKSPLGDGMWGHADLAGGVFEWNLDWRALFYPMPCHDCANLAPGSERAIRGGAWSSPPNLLPSTVWGSSPPEGVSSRRGVRCARAL